MTKQILVDVWEADTLLDEAALVANGVAGAIIRINDMNGGHHLDKNFLAEWKQCQDAGLLYAPYFVYNPWADGATNFAWLKANLPADYTGRVFVDVEVKYAGYPPATYAAQLNIFMNLLSAQHPATIYTAQWCLSNLSSWPKNFDYWWAQYPFVFYPPSPTVTTWEDVRKNAELMTSSNANLCPGTLKLWQASGDRLILPGSAGKPIDVNIFAGSHDELQVWITGKPVPAPIPVPVPVEPTVSILSISDDNGKVPELLTVAYAVNGTQHSQDVDQRLVVVPSPPPVIVPPSTNLYRILNDVQAGIELYGGPRPYIRDAKVGPPTVKLEGGSAYYKVPDLWVGYLQKINTPQGINYINKPGSGWRNGTVDWVVRTVTFAGNIVEVLRIDGNKAYIKTISTDDDLPRDDKGNVIYIKPTEAHLHPLLPIFVLQYILTGSAYDPKSTVRLDYSTDFRYVTILLMAPAGEQLWIDVRNLARLP